VIGVAQHGLEFPVHVKTVTGYDLVVDGEVSDDGRFSSVTLTGPVKKVYEGVIDWDSIDIL
jgi:diaminopimelate epimerase